MPVVGTSCVGRMRLPNKIRRAPVSFSLVALSSVVFLCLKELGLYGPILQLFNFVPLELTSRGGQLGQPGEDWWRFVTPTLLHFSWMHVVFNCLWIWEFGRRIEASLGSLNLMGLYLTSAVFSNSLQYFASGPSIFGGMSGVVSGWVNDRTRSSSTASKRPHCTASIFCSISTAFNRNAASMASICRGKWPFCTAHPSRIMALDVVDPNSRLARSEASI